MLSIPKKQDQDTLRKVFRCAMEPVCENGAQQDGVVRHFRWCARERKACIIYPMASPLFEKCTFRDTNVRIINDERPLGSLTLSTKNAHNNKQLAPSITLMHFDVILNKRATEHCLSLVKWN